MATRTHIALLYILGIALIAFFLGHPEIYRYIIFYDEGVYVVLGKALASGAGYAHVSLPGSPLEGKYPPAFPFFLSVIWVWFPDFPDNLVMMRLAVAVAGYLFLVVSFKYLTEVLGISLMEALGIITMVALHPVFIEYSFLIVSEIPYALMSTMVLYYYSRFLRTNNAPTAVLIFCLASVAALTRTVGFVLFAALIAHMIVSRRWKLSLVTTVWTTGLFSCWQLWTWHTRRGYVEYPREIAMNYVGYTDYLTHASWLTQLQDTLIVNLGTLIKNWAWFVFPWGQGIVVTSIILTLGVYFYFRQNLNNPGLGEIYCLLSLCIIAFWPWPFSDRFLLVSSPLLIAFCLIGLRNLTDRLVPGNGSAKRKQHVWLSIACIIVVAATIQNLASNKKDRELRELSMHVYAELGQTLDWVSKHTPSNAILFGDADSAFYLFTGRKAVRLAYPDPYKIWYSSEADASSSGLHPHIEWFGHSGACYFIQETSELLGVQGAARYYSELVHALKHHTNNSYGQIYTSPHRWFSVYKNASC